MGNEIDTTGKRGREPAPPHIVNKIRLQYEEWVNPSCLFSPKTKLASLSKMYKRRVSTIHSILKRNGAYKDKDVESE